MKNYEIVLLEDFNGTKASVYSVLPKGEELTLFEQFLEEYESEFQEEIWSIVDLIADINAKYGVRENLIKDKEGSPGDGLIALFDNPDKHLRLYALKYGSGIIILGGGGEKPKHVRAHQDDEKLTKEINKLKEIGKEIYQRILDKEIRYAPNEIELIGNLIFSDDDKY